MDSMAHEVAEILLSVGATAFVLLCFFGTIRGLYPNPYDGGGNHNNK
jgi:hypothetical protein